VFPVKSIFLMRVLAPGLTRKVTFSVFSLASSTSALTVVPRYPFSSYSRLISSSTARILSRSRGSLTLTDRSRSSRRSSTADWETILVSP